MARHLHFCGCYFEVSNAIRCLPLVSCDFHSTILSSSSSTQLTQTFTNPSNDNIDKAKYVFPLYDGVSVVSFTCRIGDRTIHGIVHEKVKAKAIFDQAVAQGQTAGLLQQSDEAADVFSTSLGNVPGGATIVVEIGYVGELKNDADTDGIRFTIPTSIAPRYGAAPGVSLADGVSAVETKGISLIVDVHMPAESPIQSIQSPSHPIAISMGILASAKDDAMSMNKASATLSLGEAALEKDFVLVVAAKDSGNPTAVLETHATIPNQRAVMATLVPRFSLPPSSPEIVFIADRSGSMGGNIPMLQSAMKVFLKSLPNGVTFNVLSFGSSHRFLWSQSMLYTKDTFDQALAHVDTFQADFGGTETLSAIQAAVQNRAKDFRDLDMILLTDGDIWAQESAFQYVADQVRETNGKIRLFPLGIGNGVSHSLIEGLARAGNGFAQAVQHGERLDKRVVRMLRGALSPHIYDYTLQVKYQAEDDFEMVDRPNNSTWQKDTAATTAQSGQKPAPKEISLFNAQEDPEKEPIKAAEEPLPDVAVPKVLQGPAKIPALFPFSRTTVYLLLSPDATHSSPESVVLQATSAAGPLRLEIPIQVLERPGQAIHQLAARKVVQDLEEGRGWTLDATDESGRRMKEHYSRFDEVVKREAVRLGTTFQVANKWCAFVAVPAATKDDAIAAQKEKDKETQGMQDLSPATSMPDGGMLEAPMPGGLAARMQWYHNNVQPLVLKADCRYTATALPSHERQSARSGHRYLSASSAAAAPSFHREAVSMAPAAAAGSVECEAEESDDDMGFALFSDPDASAPYGAGPGSPAPPPVPSRVRTAQQASRHATPPPYTRVSASRLGAPQPSPEGVAARARCAAKPPPPLASAPVAVDHDVGPAAGRARRAPSSSLFGGAKSLLGGAKAQRAGGGAAPGGHSHAMRARRAVPAAPAPATRGGHPQPRETARPEAADDDVPDMSAPGRVHFVIARQDFDGFWAESAGLWTALGVARERAVKAAWGRGGHAWTTILVLCWLEERMREEREVWEMVAEKARAWLDAQRLEDRAGMEAAAMKLVQG